MGNGKTSLRRWSTEELERGIYSSSLDIVQRCEAERILRERFVEPDRKLARRLYDIAAWTPAFSMGAFVVTLMTSWLLATGN
jgi:hypothetical protein